MIPLMPYLVISALLLVIGIFGAITRRSALGILMGIELILNACILNLVAFHRHTVQTDPTHTAGPMFALFVMAMAAAAVAVGLSIVITIHRNHHSVNVDEINILKW